MMQRPTNCGACNTALADTVIGFYCPQMHCQLFERVVFIGGLGVIVGRMQVPYLHEGHSYLISQAAQMHERVIVFLGSPRNWKPTQREPLDFETRKLMIHKAFPQVEVRELFDVPNDDKVWSEILDHEIKSYLQRYLRGDAVVHLYGGRLSFLDHYAGSFKTVRISPITVRSGTEIRADVTHPRGSEEFRLGAIYAVNKLFAQTPKVKKSKN